MLYCGILELIHSPINMAQMMLQMQASVSAKVYSLVKELINSHKTAIQNLDSRDRCKQDVVVVAFDV